MGKSTKKPKAATPAQDAGYFDIAEWGDKDMTGAYAPGTMLDLGDGKPIDLSAVPDHIGGRAKKRSKPAGRAPERKR